MAKKRIHSCWLLLMVALLMTNLVVSVRPTQAHYANTRVWNTVVPYEGSPVSSDCLVSEGHQTILLGNMGAGEERTIRFTLEAALPASGTLTWTVDQGEYLLIYPQTLTVEGSGSEEADSETAQGDTDSTEPAEVTTELTKDSLVALEAGEKATVILMLFAPEIEREEMVVNLTVTWTDAEGKQMLAGTFRATLLSTLEEENTESTEETTEPTEETTEPTEETTEPTEETTEPTEETTEPTEETTEPTEETTEPTEETTEPTEETTEPTEETMEPTEETTEPTEETTEPTEETTEPTENTDPTESETRELSITTLGQYDPSQWLPVSVTPAGGSVGIKLKIGLQGDVFQEVTAFPKFTRYSIDGGESWFLLYNRAYITVAVDSDTPFVLLLDLSRTTLTDTFTSNTQMILYAEEYSEEAVISICEVQTALNVEVSTQTEDAALAVAETVEETDAAATEQTEQTEQEAAQAQSHMLTTEQSSLEFVLGSEWAYCTMAYSVEMLQMEAPEEEQSEALYRYQQIDPEDGGLILTYTPKSQEQTEDGVVQIPGTITIELGEKLPAAGTYRLRVQWLYQGVCFNETQMTFFVNYSNYFVPEQTGGAEQ